MAQTEQLPPDAPMQADPAVKKIDVSSSENLVGQLPQSFLEKVGAMVVDRKNEDLQSSSKYRKRKKRHMELFFGVVPKTSTREKNIMYVHLPYMGKAVLMFHTKLHRNFFPATGDIAGVTIMAPGMKEKERAASRKINLIMRKECPEYIPAHDRGSLQCLLYGSAFSVWRWDPVEDRPNFEFASSDDIIVPYTFKSDREDMSDVPWWSWLIHLQRHQIEAYADTQWYDQSAISKIYPKAYGPDGTQGSAEPVQPRSDGLQAASDRIYGVEATTDSKSRGRVFIEHDCWLALPGEKRQRPVTITVDEETKAVLRISLRERYDPKDRQRFERDMAGWEAHRDSVNAMYEQALMQHEGAMNMHMQTMQAAMDGYPVDPQPHPGEPPIPPELPPVPPELKRIPFSRITHYQCIPNPEGFYGVGLGYLVEGHNITANEVMSLYTSLMRMNLRPTGIFSKDAKMPREDFDLILGEMKESRLPPEQIKSAFFQFQFPPPDPNAFKVEERQARAVSEVTADDILMGAQGLSGQSATEADLRASNAVTPIATIATRYNRSRSNEIKVLAILLSEKLPEEGITFLDRDQRTPQGDPDEFTIYPKDFEEDLNITFTADPNLSSQPQRERSAMKLFQTVQQAMAMAPAGVPLVDPNTAVMVTRAALAEVFRQMDRPEYAQMIEMAPPPQPPPMPGTLPPGEQNGPGKATSGPGTGGMEMPPPDQTTQEGNPASEGGGGNAPPVQ